MRRGFNYLADQEKSYISPARLVSEFMQKMFATYSPTTPIWDPKKLMLLHINQTFPIVNNKKIVFWIGHFVGRASGVAKEGISWARGECH